MSITLGTTAINQHKIPSQFQIKKNRRKKTQHFQNDEDWKMTFLFFLLLIGLRFVPLTATWFRGHFFFLFSFCLLRLKIKNRIAERKIRKWRWRRRKEGESVKGEGEGEDRKIRRGYGVLPPVWDFREILASP